jgi:hypothetical protein
MSIKDVCSNSHVTPLESLLPELCRKYKHATPGVMVR